MRLAEVGKPPDVDADMQFIPAKHFPYSIIQSLLLSNKALPLQFLRGVSTQHKVDRVLHFCPCLFEFLLAFFLAV
jgi:hypothetical protein